MENALKTYDTKKQKGKKVKETGGKIQKFFKPPLFLKVKEFLLSFVHNLLLTLLICKQTITSKFKYNKTKIDKTR